MPVVSHAAGYVADAQAGAGIAIAAVAAVALVGGPLHPSERGSSAFRWENPLMRSRARHSSW